MLLAVVRPGSPQAKTQTGPPIEPFEGDNFYWGFSHSCEAGLGDCTAEARRTQSKEFLIKKFSDLCELGASVVNTSSQKTRNNPFINIKIFGYHSLLRVVHSAFSKCKLVPSTFRNLDMRHRGVRLTQEGLIK
jgi:hypothetical protein